MENMQEYLEKRLIEAVQHHAAGQVDIVYDSAECALPMRFNDYKGESIEQTIDGFIHTAVDFFVETDMQTDGLISFNKDKILELTRELVKTDKVTQAFCAQCALLLRGYQIGARSYGRVSTSLNHIVREN